MSPRNAVRSRRRALPLFVSCGVHALLFTLLWQLAPFPAQPEVEPEPISVRMLVHAQEPQPAREFERAEPLPRSVLPAEPEFDPVMPEASDDERLLAALYDSESLPLVAPDVARRSGPIGAGSGGLQRVPRAAAANAPALALAAPAPLGDAAAAPREEVAPSVGDALVPPAPLDCPAPEYPAGSANVGEHGRVRLEIRIDRTGRVSDVRLLYSSGFRRLDDSALAGVRRWRFTPARRGDEPIEWRLEHTVVFRVLPAQG